MASCSQRLVSEQGWVKVYFCPRNDCEAAFKKALNGSSVARCALYQFNPRWFSEERFKVVSGEDAKGRGLMHDKFCVAGDVVVTGSANPTERGFHYNYNNLVVVRSRTIASNYLEEWEELRTGGNKETEHSLVNLSGVLVENYFCPEDGCEEKLLALLGGAERSIVFMTFSFTSDKVGELLAAKSRELRVEGLMESLNINKYSEFYKLRVTGVSVALERTGRMLHHKVFIVDNETVFTGSYNPTVAGASLNDENVLIIHDEGIAREFLEEYERLRRVFEKK